jgi:hypothetical protein
MFEFFAKACAVMIEASLIGGVFLMGIFTMYVFQ